MKAAKYAKPFLAKVNYIILYNCLNLLWCILHAKVYCPMLQERVNSNMRVLIRVHEHVCVCMCMCTHAYYMCCVHMLASVCVMCIYVRIILWTCACTYGHAYVCTLNIA